MTEPTPRYWEVFFELFEGLPRQGPGNRACAEKALGLCRDLPLSPAVLDLGCGVGGQTLHFVAFLDQFAQEPEMHRRNSDDYAYEFFVARRQ